ncbi:hypothetical protein QMK19_06750 [Streptomyces sp. H10-C2]|uniref:hypothetical protein n=1 Tax=unclassified Streptomyces TaxID=2593676 RepID=UPI0024BA566B|nr:MULTISPECIES: hypothetical protein [unclassified Streptomyces]MDJ0339983.1 hypothetical protein [Streptomyces sp. PH10-H1]MDJ0369380.1 hypothetical protein [Streptomyces sp. H10-C2]
MRYIDSPTLFENRPSYRLTGVDWDAQGGGQLSFGLATYFDKIDVCEAIGHELAATLASSDGATVGGPGWGKLPRRRLIGDPFDLEVRSVVPAITTLLLRLRPSGEATFFLHWRDPGKVATAGGLYDTIPAGEFQPSTVMCDPAGPDFDLWRAIVRELSEELLGTSEDYGSDTAPIDYDAWPFNRALTAARAEGTLRVYWLGLGMDPLTLVTDMLTVAVFDAELFDETFERIVSTNDEGLRVEMEDGTGRAVGIPFRADQIERLTGSEPMQPAGAALLQLAWQHRKVLLPGQPG